MMTDAIILKWPTHESSFL